MAKRLRILQETYDTVDALHNYLHGEGHRGCIGDMMLQWLEAQGATPSLPDSIPDDELSSFTVSVGTGPFTTGTELTATITGLEGGEVVSYQWTDDGADIPGATSSTYTPAIGTDSIADASDISVDITIDGTDYTATTREIRYAAGSVTESGLGDWTIDDDSLNINLGTDFNTTNLTGSFVISGLPTGAVDDGDGTISGTVDGTVVSPSTVSLTVTFTDQYGRTIVGNYTVDTVYRAQATAAGALDLSFVLSTTISSTDLSTDWTSNGNTLTFAATDTFPGTLSLSSSGTLTGGTPGTALADANYTVTATDEYGRTTPSEVALEITEALASITLSNVSYTAAAGGTPASLSVDVTYSGDDDLDAVAAHAGSSGAATAAQLIAEAGGTDVNEYSGRSQLSATSGTVSVSLPFTSSSDGSVRLLLAVVGRTTASESSVETIVVSNVDYTDQTLSSSSPSDNDTDVSITGAQTFTFGDTPYGDLIYRLVSDNSVVSTVDLEAETATNSFTVSVSGNVATVTPSLLNSTAYWVDTGSVIDEAGNPIDTATTSTTLNFTTVAAASGVDVETANATAISAGWDYQTSHSGSAAGFACTGGANNMLVAYVAISDGGANIQAADLTATYGGVSMTLLGAVSGGGLHKVPAIFYLMNPPTTTAATVVVDYNGKTGRSNVTVIEELSNVDSSTPWGTPVSNDFDGEAMSIGITPTTTDGLIRVVAGARGSNTSMTPTSDTAALYNAGTSPGGDSFNHIWTLVGGNDPSTTDAITVGATDGESNAGIIAAEVLAQ